MLPYDEKAAERFHQVAVLKIPLDLDGMILDDSGINEGQQDSHCCKLVPMLAHKKVFGLLLVDELSNSDDQESRTAKSAHGGRPADCPGD